MKNSRRRSSLQPRRLIGENHPSSQVTAAQVFAVGYGFYWFLGIIILLMVGILLAGTIVNSIAVSREPMEQAVADAVTPPSSEETSGPIVFLTGVTNKFRRPRNVNPESCKTGETWNAEVKLCAPTLRLPDPYDSALGNASVSIKDSFFHHTCGTWIKEHTNTDRTFTYGYWRNEHRIESLIQKTPRDEPLAHFYQSCVAADGFQSLQESRLEWNYLYESILGNLRGYPDLPVVFGRLAKHGFTSPFGFTIERHPLEPRMLPTLYWDENGVNVSEAMVRQVFHSTLPITQTSTYHVGDKVRRAYKVLHGLMLHSDPKSLNGDPSQSYSQYLAETFPRELIKYSSLPQWYRNSGQGGWKQFFHALDGSGLSFPREQDFWLMGNRVGKMRDFLVWLVSVAAPNFELLDWKAYGEYCILSNMQQFHPDLPDNVYYKKWDVMGLVPTQQHPKRHVHHHLRRKKDSLPKEERDCFGITQAMVPGLVAQAFLTTVPKRKALRKEIKSMTREILDRYKELVRKTSWLSLAGKTIALNKIENVIVRVLEPDEWEPEPFAPRLHRERFEHNMNLIRRYRVEQNLKLWHRDLPLALNRKAMAYFSMPLSTVNAYYSGPTNTITILGGVLQHPFWDERYSETGKRAILGSIIGHELGHLLDHHGLHWDKDGSYKPQGIWSHGDMLQFVAATQCVVEAFALSDKERKECGLPADFRYGNHTINEDMADLLGVRVALLSKPLEAKEWPMFFKAFSQAWCSSYEPKYLCKSIKTDVHATSQYRVDATTRNTEEWYSAFGIKPREGFHICQPYGK